MPTVTFQLLYCFFVIEQGHRKILHRNVMRRSSVDRVVHPLREALPQAVPYRHVIPDRCSKFRT
jgi:hypothetical protein